MKRFLSIVITGAMCASLAFAGFFDKRIFEMRMNIEGTGSNNAFALKDVLVPDLVIDLSKMADKVPKNGFNTTITEKFEYQMNFDISNVYVGLSMGEDVYVSSTIAKDFFDFFGKGNTGKNLSFDTSMNADAFLFFGLNLGYKTGRYKIKVLPSVFLPIVHYSLNSDSGRIEVSDDGDMLVDLSGRGTLYSMIDLSDTGMMSFNGMGFDVGADVFYTFSKELEFGVKGRIPLIPGHLPYAKEMSYSVKYNSPLIDFFSEGAETPEINFDFGETSSSNYQINRPLKLAAQANYKPFGDFFTVYGLFGLGVRNPLSNNISEVLWYPEYLLGAKVSFINMFVAEISTEYTDKVFIQKIQGKMNFRVFELDFGVALSGANFGSSFRGCGTAGFVSMAFGF